MPQPAVGWGSAFHISFPVPLRIRLDPMLWTGVTSSHPYVFASQTNRLCRVHNSHARPIPSKFRNAFCPCKRRFEGKEVSFLSKSGRETTFRSWECLSRSTKRQCIGPNSGQSLFPRVQPFPTCLHPTVWLSLSWPIILSSSFHPLPPIFSS